MFKGSITALITPFRDGELDESSFERLIEWQIEQGTHGLVPCGTTGEGMALSFQEKCRAIELCVRSAAGRVPVIASTGLITTKDTAEMTKSAQALGVDGILVIVPPYLKPSENGIYQHFKAVHDACELPIVLYNNPGRTSCNLSLKMLKRLAELENVVGVKDASLNPCLPMEIRQTVGEDFVFLSGDDVATVPLLAQGGQGAISITANIAPRACADLYNAWVAGDLSTVFYLRDLLFPLHQAMCIESNPTPVKYAARTLGICTEEMRAPLVPISQGSREVVTNALQNAGVLKQSVGLAS